jgi:hypothetical protein
MNRLTLISFSWRSFGVLPSKQDIIMSISGVSGFAAVSAAQQVQNQAQAAQTKETSQPDPAVRQGESHHHHHAGGAPPVQPGTASQTAGSTGINTIA